jgi:hypothetical protein
MHNDDRSDFHVDLQGLGRLCGGCHCATKALAPYALIELVLPGGSVMALLLWLYRRRKNGVGFGRLADPLRFNDLMRNCREYVMLWVH